MNPVAQRLNEASVIMEGTPHPEFVQMLRIGAEEIERLDLELAHVTVERDKAIQSRHICERAMECEETRTRLSQALADALGAEAAG